MDPKSLSKCFAIKSDFVTREIAGEIIIVPVRAKAAELDSVYTLNEPGTMIWKILDGRTSVSQVIESVAETYDVSEKEASLDTVEFLTSLEREGLIQEEVQEKRME